MMEKCQMQRLVGSASLAWALLLILGPGCEAFIWKQNIHDVKQDVAEDASLISQDMPASSQKQSPLKSFVNVTSSPSASVSVQKGHRLELKCEVIGNPPPRIYWIMGENPERQVQQLERESIADVSYTAIAFEVSKLIIECVTPQDQSLIHCVGVSGELTDISRPTVLSVQGGNGSSNAAGGHECESGSVAPVITRHRPTYFSEIGSTVELPCEALGNPRPHVRWINNEGKLINPRLDPRINVQPDGSLLIANIIWEDMGNYKCLAASAAGETHASTFLYPAAKSESEKRKANAL